VRGKTVRVDTAVGGKKVRVEEAVVEDRGGNDTRELIREFYEELGEDANRIEELEPKKVRRRKVRGERKKKHRVRRVVIAVVAVILLGGGGVVAWLWVQGNDLIAQVTDGGNLWNFITSDPNVPLDKDASSGRTNILVYGTEGYSMDDTNWDGGHLTDSIMMMSLDQESGDIKTISIPRDLKVKTCTATGKINEVYYCTYTGNDGTDESRKEYESLAGENFEAVVGEILGVEIQYYVHVNWAGVVAAVDALGGIDVAVVYKGEAWEGEEVAIETSDRRGVADYYDSKCRCYQLNYENGEVVHLNGEQALALARSRNAFGGYGSSAGNFSREVYQQKIIAAILQKARKTDFLADFGKALEVKKAVGDNIRTSFKDTELKTLFSIAGGVDVENMNSVPLVDAEKGIYLLKNASLPLGNCSGDGCQMISYVVPAAGVGNYAKIHEYVAGALSSDPVREEGAVVDVLNGSGVAGVAKTEAGRLEGENIVVGVVGDAPEGDWRGYMLYYTGDGKSATKKFLEEFYGVKAKDGLPSGVTSGADFVVVVGVGAG
jgi:LCP family protein required for cell wall assembly